MHLRNIMAVAVILLVSATAFGRTFSALERLQTSIEQIVVILKAPQYQSAKEQTREKEKIWQIVQNIFDEHEVARRALARNWMRFNPNQRREFTAVFARFLGETYLNKLGDNNSELEVVFLGEEMLGKNKALVSTKIIRENIEIPVAYNVRMQNGTWRVYDVKIEGVSLVKNYRTQFNRFLMNKSPDHLIDRLRCKTTQ